MNTKRCRPELLVDYADGDLPPEQAAVIEEHLAACRHCRSMLAGLNKSLQLVHQAWAQNEESLADFRPKRWHNSRLSGVRAGAIAAAMLLAITGSLVWTLAPESSPAGLVPRAARPPVSPNDNSATANVADGMTVAEFHARIEREGVAARMLAAANLLARQPGGEEYARQRYNDIISSYPETTAARELSKRKKRS